MPSLDHIRHDTLVVSNSIVLASLTVTFIGLDCHLQDWWWFSLEDFSPFVPVGWRMNVRRHGTQEECFVSMWHGSGKQDCRV
jgi:hypothetical protein